MTWIRKVARVMERNRCEIYFEIELICLLANGMWEMKEIFLTPEIGYMIVVY